MGMCSVSGSRGQQAMSLRDLFSFAALGEEEASCCPV